LTNTRYNHIVAIFGQRGSGKTDYLRGNKEHKLEGLMNLYPPRQMKVLIIDTFDHPSYRDIPVLPANKLESWKSGIYRVFTKPKDIPKLNNLLNRSNSIWNSLLVYEDAYKHTSKTIDESLINLMADSKQKNIDIAFMYHSFMQAPPDLYRMIDYIECFKTKDSPECRKSFMPGYFEHAMSVYNEVKANPSKFYHKLITTDLT
jgi:hypothetical protein